MTRSAAPLAHPDGERPEVVHFSDLQRVLSLFAEGIAGEFLHLAPIVGGGEPAVATGGRRFEAITTVGSTIHLPDRIGDFEDRRHNEGAYRVAVLHQIGYLEFGTHDIDLEAFVAGTSNPQLTRRIFLTLEDLRIDSMIRHNYPGSNADVARVLARALANRPPVPASRPLAFLLESLVRYSLGAPRDPLHGADTAATGPESFQLGDLQRSILDIAERMTLATATVIETARATTEICALFDSVLQALMAQPDAPASDGSTGEATDSNGDPPTPPDPALAGSNPPDGDIDTVELTDDDFLGAAVDFRGELTPDTDRGRGSSTSAASEQEPSSVSGSRKGALEQTAPEQTTEAPEPSRRASARTPQPEGPRTYFYDEWDYLRQAYVPAWCRLFEHQTRGSDFGFIHDVRRTHSVLSQQVKRRFSAIRPESWQRVHRTPDGDELSIDSLIEAVVDRRSGHATDETLYIRRDRAVRDVAAAFLLDMSRSTDSPVPDPDEVPVTKEEEPAEFDFYLRGSYFDNDLYNFPPAKPKRRVIDVARESLALMCDALQTLGDSHAIYGFSGSGRLNVEFHVAKEFSDRTSARTWAALAAMEPIRYTRMGPAIRHCVSKLSAQPERTKVLVVVTDGYPQDDGYGPNRNDRNYGIHDTARAIAEAEKAGISTFCITVDPAGNDYLREMCAPDRYLVIDDVNSLATELEKVYRTLTGHS